MDSQKSYSAYSIQRREETVERLAAERTASGGGSSREAAPARHSLQFGSRFAEVEINAAATQNSAIDKAVQFFASVAQPAPIEQRPYDPLRMKFFEMRKLASNRPFARDNSELFYKQAKFMEGFSDDYDGEAKFFMYNANYQSMGYEQLRTYFTWRAKTRRGEIAPIPGSYVFVYVNELLNNIGVSDPADGLDKLVTVWEKCLAFAPALDNYLPQWFKDYHIYYDLPHTFADFANEHGLLGYYPMNFIFGPNAGDVFELWNGISNYGVMMSKFYKDGNEQLFRDCFFAVVDGLRNLCAESNICIEDLFIYSIGKKMPWQPFRSALFHNWLQQPDCVIEMPGQERYYCRGNRWSASLPMYYSTQKDFVGYIVKKTEACLRLAVKYKYKLTAEPATRFGAPLAEFKKIDGARAALDRMIESAVSGFLRDRNRTVVTVDHANLARIRQEALGTQEKLTVPDNEMARLFGGAAEVAEWDAEADGMSEVRVAADEGPGAEDMTEAEEWSGAEDNGWADFKSSLSHIELDALGLALRGDSSIKAFADNNGVMLEVLADGINEKAADYIGDSILDTDGDLSIYEEYRSSVAAMFNRKE